MGDPAQETVAQTVEKKRKQYTPERLRGLKGVRGVAGPGRGHFTDPVKAAAAQQERALAKQVQQEETHVRILARQFSPKCVGKLADFVDGEQYSVAARVTACTLLLGYGWGPPVPQHGSADDSPVRTIVIERAIFTGPVTGITAAQIEGCGSTTDRGQEQGDTDLRTGGDGEEPVMSD